MREIAAESISEAVARMCQRANFVLSDAHTGDLYQSVLSPL